MFEELGWNFWWGKHNVINSNKTYFLLFLNSIYHFRTFGLPKDILFHVSCFSKWVTSSGQWVVVVMKSVDSFRWEDNYYFCPEALTFQDKKEKKKIQHNGWFNISGWSVGEDEIFFLNICWFATVKHTLIETRTSTQSFDVLCNQKYSTLNITKTC